MISGREYFQIYSTSCLSPVGEYNYEKDVELWKNGKEASCNVLLPGSLIIVYNNQPHKGAIQIEKPENIKKVVCKIDVD